MKVLLAIDSSSSSERVIQEVLVRPWPAEARFCVVHVADLASPHLRRARRRSLIDVQIHASEALVATAAKTIGSRGLEAITHVGQGHAASKIVEYCSEWNADFVIVGSHGQSAATRFFLGSVAHTVVRLAPCSVEIVRASSDRPAFNAAGMRILLATDGSESSLAAAQSVAERPWPDGAKFRAISVVYAVDPIFEQWRGTPEDIARIESESLSQGEDDVAAAQHTLARAGLEAVGRVLRGYPKELIVDEAKAWDADLIVVGSHGRRGIARLLMGSVSEAVAMHAHCSVEVIRSTSPSRGD